MQVSYSRTMLAKSIFLAGPTPRSNEVKSWRPEAVKLLEQLDFDGTVFVPEDATWSARFSYDDQVEWELQALHSATAVVFWVPREISTMPAFTTNVEFGLFARHPNVVLGFPDGAEKMRYLEAVAQLHHLPVERTLEATLQRAISITARPFPTVTV